MNKLKQALGVLARLWTSAGHVEEEADRLTDIEESKVRSNSVTSPKLPLINLADGAPDSPTPPSLKQAAVNAINSDLNQYSHPWGDAGLRKEIARFLAGFSINADADKNVTVTSGTSSAIGGVLLATLNPGDEVIVLEPFFEGYLSAIRLAGAVPRFVALDEGDWTIDEKRLKKAFNRRTRAIILNTPHNPTGRVFSQQELELIGDLCAKTNALIISDEIYGQLVYDGKKHISPASLPALKERTVVISGLSKAYNVTGWRIGYVAAPEPITNAFRKVHAALGLSAPTPLQHAARVALADTQSVDATLVECQDARDRLCAALSRAGFLLVKPEGATYIFANAQMLGFACDIACRNYLALEFGVSSVPGSYFRRPEAGGQWLRLCFARNRATVDAACERLEQLAKARGK